MTPLDTTGYHILVVDDYDQSREVLRGFLEEEGYRVETASDGQEGVDKALAQPPRLILMDVNMPRLSGIDACRILKQDDRTHLVPLVLITGLVEREDRLKGVEAGCDDFLTKPVDFEQLKLRTRNLLRSKALIDELETAENVLVSLVKALEVKDLYTSGHSERVSAYAEMLGGAAGLGAQERKNLKRAGLLHDIGKIGIPLDYLRKPGKLTTEEYEIVKRHPAIGYDICKPLRTMAPLIGLIRGHHEQLGGRGYPDGLKAEEIPLPLRCLTIADVFDALTSDRPYRGAMTSESAFRIMREEASMGMWDARVIDIFAATIQKEGL